MPINETRDAQGIVTLTMDLPDRSANVLNPTFFAALTECLERLEGESDLTGVILISGKRHWMVGADLDSSFEGNDPQTYFDQAQAVKRLFRRLETLGRPVVAALNGSALGGGLELALACHHRIALDDPRIRFGFPEVALALLPGGGGVVRSGRLLGLQNALEWLTRNRRYDPAQALAAGMIDALAPDQDALMARARAWIAANPGAQAPWDGVRGDRIPGGGPHDPRIAPLLALAPAMIRKETRGNEPAPPAILAALVEGAQVDFETACRIESRYFATLAAGQVSTNRIRVLWSQLNQIKRGASRPADVPRRVTTRVGVLGAGMMGHGIAYVTARAGIEVVMIDATDERAVAGKEKIAALLARRVARGRSTAAEQEEVLARIHAAADYGRLEDCDLVIEAVFEDRALKAEVTRAAEGVTAPGALFATNTSTLPITSLAQASVRPAQFIGMHFFSPVHKMPLVEIIMGHETSRESLARAFDFVLAIRKIPIVVSDRRGFYTSRVFATWTNEALAMLAEGQLPQTIEMAGLQAGMPVGPLALMDELSLRLLTHVRDQRVVDLAATGTPYEPHPGERVLDHMVALGRAGRAAGAGFYDYQEGSKHLWPGLRDQFMDGQPTLGQPEMIERLLFIQSIEAVRCLDEGVVHTVADANLGAILGWGYPSFHGGPLQFINAYGVERFVSRAQELAKRYGPRFAPPASLVAMGAQNAQF